MGGPWRAKGYDPAAWALPPPRIEAGGGPSATARDPLMVLVIGYVAAVITSAGLMLVLLKAGLI